LAWDGHYISQKPKYLSQSLQDAGHPEGVWLYVSNQGTLCRDAFRQRWRVLRIGLPRILGRWYQWNRVVTIGL